MGNDKGAALIVTVLALTLLLATAAALVLVTSTDLLIAENATASAEAFHAAEGAFERTIAELTVVADFTAVLNGTVVSGFVDGSSGPRTVTGGIALDLGQVVNFANCARAILCTDTAMNQVTADRPWGARNPRWRLFSHGVLDSASGTGWSGLPVYSLSLVADDPSETDGDPQLDGAPAGGMANPGAGVLLVRAEGLSRRGAHRVIEGAVVRRDLAARAAWEAADPATRGDPPGGPPVLHVVSWQEVR
jgi:hypothetical protein